MISHLCHMLHCCTNTAARLLDNATTACDTSETHNQREPKHALHLVRAVRAGGDEAETTVAEAAPAAAAVVVVTVAVEGVQTLARWGPRPGHCLELPLPLAPPRLTCHGCAMFVAMRLFHETTLLLYLPWCVWSGPTASNPSGRHRRMNWGGRWPRA